uniref:Uncharacterized protein n=1 Tax=Cacopsylla melanoneura TaxID=428564 RepID=A0A8D9FI33_9HEMI
MASFFGATFNPFGTPVGSKIGKLTPETRSISPSRFRTVFMLGIYSCLAISRTLLLVNSKVNIASCKLMQSLVSMTENSTAVTLPKLSVVDGCHRIHNSIFLGWPR